MGYHIIHFTHACILTGKSTVIALVYELITSILQRSGDLPEQPYVLKTAFTGTAASNIGGGTLTSTFQLGFGNSHQCFRDKDRDKKKQELKDLVCVIIDEISMVKADMLYMLDMKLQEVKDNKKSFGGVAILAFGDIFQLKPVCGKYIFEKPSNPTFYPTYRLNNLWNKFSVVNLTTNHRQGASGEFTELLNRARVLRHGEMEEEDIKTWESRVRSKGHPDLESASINIICKRKTAANLNKTYLMKLKGEEIKCEATTAIATQKNFKPTLHRSGDGTIAQTGYMLELKLKVGAKVMLIKNVRTSDGLTNGQLGVLAGVMKDTKGGVHKLMVKFDKPDVGKTTRNERPQLEIKFPGATAIERAKEVFSLARSSSAKATLYQFPIVLAHAVTVHKTQGMTIYKPLTANIDMMSLFEPAQGFTGASRTQELNQLFIMDKFDPKKVYASPKAIEEFERMNIR